MNICFRLTSFRIVYILSLLVCLCFIEFILIHSLSFCDKASKAFYRERILFRKHTVHIFLPYTLPDSVEPSVVSAIEEFVVVYEDVCLAHIGIFTFFFDSIICNYTTGVLSVQCCLGTVRISLFFYTLV